VNDQTSFDKDIVIKKTLNNLMAFFHLVAFLSRSKKRMALYSHSLSASVSISIKQVHPSTP